MTGDPTGPPWCIRLGCDLPALLVLTVDGQSDFYCSRHFKRLEHAPAGSVSAFVQRPESLPARLASVRT